MLDHKSQCDIPPIQFLNNSSIRENDTRTGCWHHKTFEKAVVVVIDALRYDFTVPQVTANADEPYYHNKLSVLYETAARNPKHALLRPFIADPPTTTLQRLKGLTTGTLPTFIDAGSNFAGTAIDEDNLLYQLKQAGRRIVHLGDDTWHALFPGYFEVELTRPFDSFNVWDLHTVDDGVNAHLFPLLEGKNATKWDVVFAHYLGVDHAGHRYGPDHPAMAAKLRQMDEVIRKLIADIDDSTLLVVMGDHGMDSKGDHGGESDDEIQAAIWMYSKQPVFGRLFSSEIKPPQTAKERPVAQIDLVPTLALMLGLPIPFNNLGAPIEEAFVGQKEKDLSNLAHVNHITAGQVERYRQEYMKVQSLDSSATEESNVAWKNALDRWGSIRKAKNPTKAEWMAVATDSKSYQQANLRMCRRLWAQFDVGLMIGGIMVLLQSVIALSIYANQNNEDVTKQVWLYVRVAGLAIGGLGLLLQYRYSATFAVVTSLGLGLALFGPLLKRKATLFSILPTSLWSWVCIVIPILLSIGFASNSFTIWEDEILLFFLASIGSLLFLYVLRVTDQLRRSRALFNAVIFMVILRVASLSRLCREEQMPFCRSTYYASASSSTSATWQILIPFVSAAALPETISLYCRQVGSVSGRLATWINVYFRSGLVLNALYWTIQTADDGGWFSLDSSILRTVEVSVAKVVLLIAFGGACYSILQSFPTTHSNAANPNQTDSPERTKHKMGNKQRPTIHSSSHYNSVTSTHTIQITAWTLAVMLVQKPMGGGSIAILCWQIFCLLDIFGACQHPPEAPDHTRHSNSKVPVPTRFIAPTTLALLGSFHFFKTGHQATLASIQWESAFVALRTVQYPWSPILIVLNTFGAQIMCVLAVPAAVVVWQRQRQRERRIQRVRATAAGKVSDGADGSDTDDAQKKRSDVLGDVARALAVHLLFYGVVNLATVLWAGWLRRHLMLFRIFSPRFMLGATVLLVLDVVVLLVGLPGVLFTV